MPHKTAWVKLQSCGKVNCSTPPEGFYFQSQTGLLISKKTGQQVNAQQTLISGQIKIVQKVPGFTNTLDPMAGQFGSGSVMPSVGQTTDNVYIEEIEVECNNFVNVYTSTIKDGVTTEKLTSSGKMLCGTLEELQNNTKWLETHRLELIEQEETQPIPIPPIDTPESLFTRDKDGNKIYRVELIESITITDTI